MSAKPPREAKPCTTCGKMFGPRRNSRGYFDMRGWRKTMACSRSCAVALPYEEKPCVTCGKMFGPRKRDGRYGWHDWRKAAACSQPCAQAGNARTYAEKPCATCGKMFGPHRKRGGGYGWTKWRKTKTCSMACRNPRHEVHGAAFTTAELAALLTVKSGTITSRVIRGLDPLTGKKK